MDRNTENHEPILTSAPALFLATHPLCALRDPARKISKNYVVPDDLVLMNIILLNEHISYRRRVV